MYDYLIVGAGLFGSVFAHEMKKTGKKCLVVESRNHIGGNCYTEKINNINVHIYGPHIFHTNNKQIWRYIRQFAKFNHYRNHVKAVYKDKIYSLPINLMTFYQVAGCKTPKDVYEYLSEKRVLCENPKNLEEYILSQVGNEIYEILIKGYTKKQWQKDPRDLPASIIKRLPIRTTFDDNYFSDTYQGIPIGGYTQIFEKMLNGTEVQLGVDFFDSLYKNWQKIAKKLIYTGSIDKLFDYKYGELEYRTVRFENEFYDISDYQGQAVVNYTDENVPYTRVTEHKHFEFGKQENTIITKEYPDRWSRNKTPYYPINNEINNNLYQKYKEIAKKQGIIMGGRLGRYTYYEMDQVIASSLYVFKKHRAHDG